MKKNNRLLIVVFAVLALIIGVLKGVDYYRYTKVSKERVSSIQAEFVGETAPSQELSMSMFDVTVYTETGSVYSARSFDIDEKKHRPMETVLTQRLNIMEAQLQLLFR